MTETIEVRAERGYRAYGDFVEWKNYAGLPMPKWGELPEKIRGAWVHATGALIVDHDDSRTPSFADFTEVFARIAVLLTGESGDAIREDVHRAMGRHYELWVPRSKYAPRDIGASSGGLDFTERFRADYSQYPQPQVSETDRQEILSLIRCWVGHSFGQPCFNAAGPDMKHGVYDHFKGGVYLSTDVSEWASGKCEPIVSYISLVYGRKFTRFAHEWQSIVRWPDGQYRSRFVYRGPDLNTPEPPFKVRKESR